MKNVLRIGVVSLLCVGFLFGKDVGLVNGMRISEAEANKALKVLTGGKKTWAGLTKKEKQEVLQMIAPSKVIVSEAKKSLSKTERESALANFWLQKKIEDVKISDSEAKSKYATMKKIFKKNSKNKKIPSFKEMETTIKMQLAKEKVVKKLMSKSKIQLR